MNEQTNRWCKAQFTVENPDSEPVTITVSGRNRFALEMLMTAGKRGCTTYQTANRLSAYVFDLKAMGVHIQTIMETHDGPFPGQHGRYILQSIVTGPKRREVGA